MSFNFQKTYELKQQTPLIHFQYDQQGATLRATEVKPKLDRYLISRYKAEHPNEEIPLNWWINPDKDKTNEVTVKALNYRIIIQCQDKEKVELSTRDFSIFYGNAGREADKIGGVRSNNIKLSIVCINSGLRDFINRSISDFFIIHNFGNMQRKGFGSFIINGITSEEIAKLLCTAYHSKYCYVLPAGAFPFVRIKTLYSLMKSGYNFRNIYKKSLLFQYMKKLNIQNEKHGLKVRQYAPKVYKPENISKVYENIHKNHLSPNEEFYYVRALLGLAGTLEFKGQAGIDRRGNQKTYSIVLSDGSIQTRSNAEDAINLKIGIEQKPDNQNSNNENEEIFERLKSPVFFKIIDNKIYYVGEPVNHSILGKTFVFTSSWDDTIGKVGIKRKTEFTVPTAEQLGDSDKLIDSFLEYVYDQRNGFKDLSDLMGVTITKYNEKGELHK